MESHSRLITTMALEVTKRCPLSCFYCYNVNDNDRDTVEITTAQWVQIIENLPKLKMGIITGGEPLLRKDIFTIIRKLATITENQILLTSGQIMSDEIASRVTDADIALQVQVSDIGARYDENSRSKGAFKRLERSIITFNKHNLLFTTSIVISKSNLNRLESILSFHMAAGSSHVLAIRYIPQIGQKDLGEKGLTISDYKYMLMRLNRFSKKNNLPISLGIPNLPCVALIEDYKEINMPHCNAGNDYYAVDELGRLKICPHHITPGLSLLDVSFEEALEGLREVIIKNKKLPGKCEECSFVNKCRGGCRSGALSSARVGDPVCSVQSTNKSKASYRDPDPLLRK